MKIGAGPSMLICSKARTCSKVKRHAGLREVRGLAVLRWLTCISFKVMKVFFIMCPNGKEEKTRLQSQLSEKKSAWAGLRLGRTFVDQRMMGDVKKQLRTKRLVKNHPEERSRVLDGQPTMARSNVSSIERRDKYNHRKNRAELWHREKGCWRNSASY